MRTDTSPSPLQRLQGCCHVEICPVGTPWRRGQGEGTGGGDRGRGQGTGDRGQGRGQGEGPGEGSRLNSITASATRGTLAIVFSWGIKLI